MASGPVSATAASEVSNAWRPAPWIAAVLGFLGGIIGLLYVQRPWLAVAYLSASVAALLAILYAIFAFDLAINVEMLSWGGWVLRIVLAVHSYTIAVATPAVAQRKWYSRWYTLIAVPLTLFVFVFLYRSFGYETYTIPGDSMYPTIPRGSFVFVSKSGSGRYGTYGITIWRSEPAARLARGDIVAYRLVSNPTLTYLHRIVGLPGDRIEYANRQLVINGNTVPLRLGTRDHTYQYAAERLGEREATIAFIAERYASDWAGIVPPDHYVVFGDNRDNSRDSRFREVGFVPRDHIIGRVVKILGEPNPR